MVRFQLIRMTTYAKNKQQMCSVNQHQFRRRQRCGKFSQIHPVHSLFVSYKKLFVLTEQSINPLTPNVAIWQHTYFRHHNFIKKC